MKFNCEQCNTRYTIAAEKIEGKVLKIRCKVCSNVMVVRGERSRTGSVQIPSASLPPDPLGPVDELEWYAAPGNEQLGPMPLERILSMIHSGEIGRETLIWNETFDAWVAAYDVQQLEKFFPPPLPTVAVDVAEPSVNAPISALDTVQTNPTNRAWEPRTPVSDVVTASPVALDEEPTIEKSERSARVLDEEPTIEATDRLKSLVQASVDSMTAVSFAAPESKDDGPDGSSIGRPTRKIEPELVSQSLEEFVGFDSQSEGLSPMDSSVSATATASVPPLATDSEGSESEGEDVLTDIGTTEQELKLGSSATDFASAATLDPQSSLDDAEIIAPQITSSPVAAETSAPGEQASATDRNTVNESSLLEPMTVPPLAELLDLDNIEDDSDSSDGMALLAPISDAATINAPPPQVDADPSVNFSDVQPHRLVFSQPDKSSLIDREAKVGQEAEDSFFSGQGAQPSAQVTEKVLPRRGKSESRNLSGLLLLSVLLPAIGGGAAMLWSIMDDGPTRTTVEKLATSSQDALDATVQPTTKANVVETQLDAAVAAPLDASVEPIDAAAAVKVDVQAVEKPLKPKVKKKRPEKKQPKKESKTDKKPISPFARSLLAGSHGPGVKLPPPTKKKAEAEEESNAQMPDELSQAQILGVIKQYKKALQRCHERQLKREPLKESRLTLRFRIRPSGRTSSVSIGRQYDGTILKGCLDSLVRRWRFPRFRGEPIDIEYPLIFTTQF